MSISKTPHLQLTIARLAEAAKRMDRAIWSISANPLPISALPATDAHRPFAEVDPSGAERIATFPHQWGPMYSQRWFFIDLKAADLDNKETFLFWKDEGEATLYVDGLPWGGFDPAHKSVRLPENFERLAIEGTCCQTGIWISDASGISENGSTLRGAFLGTRDAIAWDVYHDFKVLFDLAVYLARRDGFDPEDLTSGQRFRKPLERLSPQARLIFTELDRIVDHYDTGGAAAAGPELKALYKRLPKSADTMQITLTGHAHIDLVLIWPERIGEAKAVHTFATANQLLERFPEFHFGYSQPASYEAVQRRSPELMKQVKGWIEAKRWEPTGAMYVESDTQLACGEALARSFLLGQEGFRELTGEASPVVWLPDVFGYSGCLPQLMRECGAKYFFTTKQAWSNSTRFPFSSFRWRGNDGSEVTAHVLHSVLANCYNTTVNIDEVVEPTLSHQQSGIHTEALIPVGYGDGGGGPTEEMCERARRIQSIQGVPPTRWGRIDDFFERMEPVRGQLPLWHGEIYLEYHRGVQTTQVGLKQQFRNLERSLQYLEAAHALAGEGPIDSHYWKRLVFAQFHDYIPGSSIHEVYDEGVPELKALADQAMNATTSLFAASSETAWFNPHAHEIQQIFQKDGKLFRLNLPPLSTTQADGAESFSATLHGTESELRSDRVHAQINTSGEIAELSIDGKKIEINGSLNQLRVYPDHPANFEAWDIDRQTPANPLVPVGPARLTASRNEADEVSLAVELQLTEKSTAHITYRLRPNEPVLRVSYEIDWQDPEHLLQALFPTNYTGKTARFGAPFGSTARPQMSSDAAADAQFEVPGSRWAIVSDDNEQDGLALITRDRYGFGCKDGLLHVSLVRSALVTGATEHRALRKRDYAHDYSDLERHRFEIALSSGALSAPRAEQPAALCDLLYAPAIEVNGATVQSPLQGLVGGDSLIPAWIQPLEDKTGFVLRLHETRGLRGTSQIKLAPGWSAEVTNISGTESAPLEADNTFDFTPYSIRSLRIRNSAH